VEAAPQARALDVAKQLVEIKGLVAGVIILPGSLVGLLTGFATMRYGRPPVSSARSVA